MLFIRAEQANSFMFCFVLKIDMTEPGFEILLTPRNSLEGDIHFYSLFMTDDAIHVGAL